MKSTDCGGNEASINVPISGMDGAGQGIRKRRMEVRWDGRGVGERRGEAVEKRGERGRGITI
jgi:hypothetical protein